MQALDVARIATIVHGPMESLYPPVQEGLDDLISIQTDTGAQQGKHLCAAAHKRLPC